MFKRRITGKLLVLLGLLVIAVLVVLTRPDSQQPVADLVPLRVIPAPVLRQDLTPVERLSGRLQPVRRVTLRFEVAGQLQTRPVEPGQPVEAGALLLALDTADYADVVQETEAQYEVERASVERDRRLLDLAEANRKTQAREVERLQKLGTQSLVSASRLDESRQRLLQLQAEEAQLKHSVLTAKARLALRKAARDQAQRNLDRTGLNAPFAGRVNRVLVDVGDYVTAGTQAIELIDVSELDLYLEVRGETAAALTLGQTFPVLIGDRSVQGRLVAVQTDPDPTTFTHAIRVRIAGDQARPGELAQIELPLQPLHDVLTVPSTALLREAGHQYVFRIEADRLQRVEVRAGPQVQAVQVLYSGVEAGQQVVARDVAALSDGQQVSVAAP